MRQFGCTQRISPQPQELDDLHKFDMRERSDEDWATFHMKYIEFQQHRHHGSRIYYLLHKEVGNVAIRGQDEGPSIPGQEDRHLLHMHTKTRLSCNLTHTPVYFTPAPQHVQSFSTPTPSAGIYFAQPPSPALYYTPYVPSPYATPYSDPSIVSQTPLASLFFQAR
ncbi:hypothetical protein Goarm_005122 [Gossypium armourianum]|uniref:Uncharacterized protein n=1 Tax=Gossypium armourianum TaxID=34283 RepID=A0A7J9JZ13_9ROSI|nr:hypothetical protein [Gossypium armourianum]